MHVRVDEPREYRVIPGVDYLVGLIPCGKLAPRRNRFDLPAIDRHRPFGRVPDPFSCDGEEMTPAHERVDFRVSASRSDSTVDRRRGSGQVTDSPRCLNSSRYPDISSSVGGLTSGVRQVRSRL